MQATLAVRAVSLQNCGVSRQNDKLELLYDEAVFELALGNVDQCIEKLHCLLKDDPDYFDAQLALSTALMRKEDYPAALLAALRAAELDPKSQMAQMNLSMIYVKMGDKEHAEKHALTAKILHWKQAGIQMSNHQKENIQKELAILAQKPSLQSVIFTKKKDENSNE